MADLIEEHDAYAILDEVYEHLVFGAAEHVSLRQLQGMQDRAIRIGSAGKTFSLTGWKVGREMHSLTNTLPVRLIGYMGKESIVFLLPISPGTEALERG